MSANLQQHLAYREQFRSRFHEDFQSWFETLATCLHPSGDFQAIRKTRGDGGLDGFAIASQRVYQVHAPARMGEVTDGLIARKVKRDFQKAKRTLKGHLKEWCFVHNHPEGTVGSLTASSLGRLRAKNPDVQIRVLGINSLWEELAKLPAHSLEKLFPIKEKDPASAKVLSSQAEAEIERVYLEYTAHRFETVTMHLTDSNPFAIPLHNLFIDLRVIREIDTTIMKQASESDILDQPENDRLQSSSTLGHNQKSSPNLRISDALRMSNHLIIIGRPGAGKTTLLKFLAKGLAEVKTASHFGLRQPALPLMIPLREFDRHLANLKTRGDLKLLGPALLPSFVLEYFRELAPQLSLPDDFVLKRLNADRCIFLLDGLDEMPASRRGEVAEAISETIRAYPGNRLIATTRPHGYDGLPRKWLGERCSTWTLCEFDASDQASFVRAWYGAVQSANGVPEGDILSPEIDLLRDIRTNARIRALASNPLLLSILVLVHKRRYPQLGLPQQRVALYDECTRMLLGYWDQMRGGMQAASLAEDGGGDWEWKRYLLEKAAYWMYARRDRQFEVSEKKLIAELASNLPNALPALGAQSVEAARNFLRAISERSGLIVLKSGDYSFVHDCFGEYFAARALADQLDPIQESLNRIGDGSWREIILLAVGHMAHPPNGFPKDSAAKLVEAIHSDKERVLFAYQALAETDGALRGTEVHAKLIPEMLTLWKTEQDEAIQQQLAQIFANLIWTTGDGETIVNALLRAVQSPCLVTRNLGLQTIARAGELAAAPPLLDGLAGIIESEARAAAITAIDALSQFNSVADRPRVVGALKRSSECDDPCIRYAAEYALEEILLSDPSE